MHLVYYLNYFYSYVSSIWKGKKHFNLSLILCQEKDEHIPFYATKRKGLEKLSYNSYCCNILKSVLFWDYLHTSLRGYASASWRKLQGLIITHYKISFFSEPLRNYVGNIFSPLIPIVKKLFQMIISNNCQI